MAVSSLATLMMVLGTVCVSCACPSTPSERVTWVDCKMSQQYGFDRADFEVAGRRGFVIFPAGRTGAPLPWVWYAPTFIGAYPAESNRWMGERLLAQGIAICGVDVGESYGNPEGRAAFTQFHKFVVSKFGLKRECCLWAQSRGGLMHYNWAVEHPDLVKCIGGTFPVCDLASYPGLAAACSAYGMTESELRLHLAEQNPIDRLTPLAAHKVPIFLVHGDSDGVVPLESNSAELARRYKALGGPVELLVVKGKGHEVVPEFFECQKMVDFFVRNAVRAHSR